MVTRLCPHRVFVLLLLPDTDRYMRVYWASWMRVYISKVFIKNGFLFSSGHASPFLPYAFLSSLSLSFRFPFPPLLFLCLPLFWHKLFRCKCGAASICSSVSFTRSPGQCVGISSSFIHSSADGKAAKLGISYFTVRESHGKGTRRGELCHTRL